MLMLMEWFVDLVVLNLFLVVLVVSVVGRLLQAYQLFRIAHQQVSGGSFTLKISVNSLE